MATAVAATTAGTMAATIIRRRTSPTGRARRGATSAGSTDGRIARTSRSSARPCGRPRPRRPSVRRSRSGPRPVAAKGSRTSPRSGAPVAGNATAVAIRCPEHSCAAPTARPKLSMMLAAGWSAQRRSPTLPSARHGLPCRRPAGLSGSPLFRFSDGRRLPSRLPDRRPRKRVGGRCPPTSAPRASPSCAGQPCSILARAPLTLLPRRVQEWVRRKRANLPLTPFRAALAPSRDNRRAGTDAQRQPVPLPEHARPGHAHPRFPPSRFPRP